MFLLSNDDGKTLLFELLFKSAKKVDNKSFGIIPDRQRSATSKAMTFHKPLRLNKIDEDLFTLNGNPADCIAIGLHNHQVSELKNYKPEIVLSGINHGHNISLQSFFTSGTIGACIEAIIHGKKAIAFSIDYKPIKEYDNKTLTLVEEFITKLLFKIKKNSFPKGIDLISINFPDEFEKIEIQLTKLRTKNYDVEIIEDYDPEERKFLWLSGIYHECDKNCNDKECHHLIKDKKITITPMSIQEKYHINEMNEFISDLYAN